MKTRKLIKSIFLSLVMLLVIVLPVFASSFPAQQDVSLDKEWRIKFNQPVDADTLEGNIVITRTDVVYIMAETFPITPVLDQSDSKVVTIKHSTPFVGGATYQLLVTTGIKDDSGRALTEDVTMPFTITKPVSSDSVEITNIDLSAEVATISNTGSSAVDLTGWKLVSVQGSQTFSFPSGTIIQAGGSLKIVSGPTAATGTNTLLWTKSNIWLNSGDPGALYDSQGQIVSRYPQ